MLGRHSRITLPIDTVIVHGRPELTIKQDPEVFRQRTGARLIRCARPDFDPAAAALGVALANCMADETGHNLARTLKPAVSFREIFPWGELVLHGALVGAVSLFLIGTAREANARLKAAGTQLSSFSWLKKQDQAKLDAEKKTLQERLKVVQAFRGNRVDWSVVLRTVAAAVPESTTITGLSGNAELESTSKSGSSKAQETTDRQFRDADGRGWVRAARDRWLPRGPARRRDAQAALPAHRDLRPQGQPGQDWRSSVHLLQRRLFAQGRNEQEISRQLAGDYPRAIFPMDEKKAKTDYKQVILEQLRQPLKLRLLLCLAIIAGWYVLFFSPLSEQMDCHHVQDQPGAQTGRHREPDRAAQEGHGALPGPHTRRGRRQ